MSVRGGGACPRGSVARSASKWPLGPPQHRPLQVLLLQRVGSWLDLLEAPRGPPSGPRAIATWAAPSQASDNVPGHPRLGPGRHSSPEPASQWGGWLWPVFPGDWKELGQGLWQEQVGGQERSFSWERASCGPPTCPVPSEFEAALVLPLPPRYGFQRQTWVSSRLLPRAKSQCSPASLSLSRSSPRGRGAGTPALHTGEGWGPGGRQVRM